MEKEDRINIIRNKAESLPIKEHYDKWLKLTQSPVVVSVLGELIRQSDEKKTSLYMQTITTHDGHLEMIRQQGIIQGFELAIQLLLEEDDNGNE